MIILKKTLDIGNKIRIFVKNKKYDINRDFKKV